MTEGLLKRVSAPEGVVTNSRYKWVEFEAEDGSVYRVKVRTSLMNEEIEKLVDIDLGGNQHELWEATYQYVDDWNINVVVEEDGEDVYYEVLAPRHGGPESFRYAPRQLVVAIIGALINEPFAKVSPKSLTPVESTA
jgi:hypothetical protein